MPRSVVASVVAVGLMLVAIYASSFCSSCRLDQSLLFFPSHDLTYVPNVFLSLVLIIFLSFCTISVLASSGVVWAIGLVEPLCGCTEFA